ncbi:MAG: single-stranded-DNA-specific exonuclease RecJ [Alphaproteobacteria bacterium]|nr:single-stranded-DNA-specific exonuclease RecJ [Alphaproteobacteria bacterium]
MKTIAEKSLSGKKWMESAAKAQNKDIVSNVLESRGITDPADVQNFLNPCMRDQMPDPGTLSDMERAVSVAKDAVLSGKKIAIFGDYDVDGITSTAIIVKYLRALGLDPLWHLPSRDGEGYGLNPGAIEEFAAAGAELLITVDCGISGVAEVARAKELGMSVIITDHHSPGPLLPAADAIVNPKRVDDTSGLSYLAGVGVAFMFLVALNRSLRDSAVDVSAVNLLEYMDLVALGTICDTMPLIKLNRAFVATGIKIIDARQNLGLRTLMEIAGAKAASVYVAGFVIGPRLNAAGRMSDASPALELLLTDNPGTAAVLAGQLDKQNSTRKDIENGILMRATEMAEQCCADGKCSLYLSGAGWHGGVMGIIAGRLKDKFGMPTCVATKSDGVINGSGRGVRGVDLGAIIHDALDAGILTEGGGHAAAAGFSLSENNENAFCEFLEARVREILGAEQPRPEIIIDAQMDAGGANMKLVREMDTLAPFGQGNPEPMLLLYGGELAYATAMGGGAHLRGALRTSAGTSLNFVGFNLARGPIGKFLLDESNIGRKITMCGRITGNEYNGRTTAQFVIEDIAV